MPGHDDLELAQLVERQLLARDDDRPVARADARAVRQQRVVLLHERVRGERDRGHLEPRRSSAHSFSVWMSREHVLELEAARVDEVRRSAQNMNASSGSGLWPRRISKAAGR